MEGMFKDNEQVSVQCDAEKKEFELELTETNATNQELYPKVEEDPHLLDAEKKNSEGLTIAELQTNPSELIAIEKEIPSHINEDLTTEVSSLEDHLNGHNTELPETENQRIEELIVENDRLRKQFEDLREKHVRGTQRKDMQYETFREKIFEMNQQLQRKRLEVAKAKEQKESLEKEVVSLRDENSSLSQRLDVTNERSREISENCFVSRGRVLELEGQSLELHAELAAATSAYGDVTLQLNNIRKDMNTLLKYSQQIQEEKAALDEKLMLEICKSNALVDELLSMKYLFSENKASAFKEELEQTEISQNQNLDVVTEKNAQISDIIQNRYSTVAKENRSELADTVKHMDVHPKPIVSRSVPKPNSVNESRKPNRVNEIPKPRSVQENRKPAPKSMHGKGKPSSTKSRL